MAGGSLLFPCFSVAGESTFALAEKEIQRRAETVSSREMLLPEAETLLRKGETAAALKIYEEVYTGLPDVPLAQEARALALDGYVRSGLVRAQELTTAGDYPGATALLDRLDSQGVAKGDKRISRMRALFSDPDRYPPALTPGHVARVAEVKTLLELGNSQREIGEYDKSLLTFEEVLRLDPYNSAARLGMQKTEADRTRYLDAAKDHTRSKMLNDVSGAWENPVAVSRTDVSSLFNGSGTTGIATGIRGGREAIQQKLRDLKIARIDFSGASLQEVVEYLRVRSRDLDPAGRGIDFVISLPPDFPSRPISLNLIEVPLEEVLRYVAEIAGLSYRVEEFAVRLVTAASGSSVIITKTYRVPPDFITRTPVGAEAPATADPFANTSSAPTSGLGFRRMGAQEYLQSYGILFGEGASATYSAVSGTLMVRNTASNLELVDNLVEQALTRSPKQVIIDVKLMDVGEDRLTELGFDWLLGGGGVSNDQYVLGGGTPGNLGSALASQDFPFQNATTAVGANPVTAGLRSSADLGVQGVDGVLAGIVPSTARRSPGVLSVAGVLTTPQFQGVLRALDQKKGIDMTAQPSVITRTGQQASLEIIRELIYPTEFDPPQIPTTVGNTTLVDAVTGALIPLPLPPAVITPTTPTAFEMRRTGVVLNVTPEISEDGKSVDLTLNPEFTDFTGFVNYGSPINTVTDGEFFELTPNLIFQPVFDSKRIVTSVKVWDGATVVLGGVITDREELIDDKVPVMGDLPFIGRFFKSTVKQRRLRNVVMFVSVRVVDPSGARINPDQ
ncbi:Amuc_1098 family type IV pilus outer membrane protein [Prosthecobacter sp. SYSU 5D2]|uniref:Amuc_1098 family type IV pilus outer membrane protein n=1 Tax=Prosthecobacter sp. SYSU 5D2 TaxID=3134134 RepID=UPI0031FE4EA5